MLFLAIITDFYRNIVSYFDLFAFVKHTLGFMRHSSHSDSTKKTSIST